VYYAVKVNRKKYVREGIYKMCDKLLDAWITKNKTAAENTVKELRKKHYDAEVINVYLTEEKLY